MRRSSSPGSNIFSRRLRRFHRRKAIRRTTSPTLLAPAAPAAEKAVVGYAFWTTDLEPLERAYDGPIQILVGINPRGVLAGIIVTAHREPYGSFSVDPPEFAAQFAGKDVRDPFKVGTDIEAVSRATISITSATRAIEIARGDSRGRCWFRPRPRSSPRPPWARGWPGSQG